MKIDIIQFLKKLNWAGRLAQSDCLFLIEHLKSFSFVSKLARLWVVKNDLEPPQKITAMLQRENNPFLTQIFNEAAAQPKISGSQFYFLPEKEERFLEGKSLLKQAALKGEWDDLKDVCLDIVTTDYPWLLKDFNNVLPVMDLKTDMRFYGVEFERLLEYTSGCSEACELSIDWGMTDKPKLYLDVASPIRQTSTLSVEAQQNLVSVYSYLLFEKNVFPGNFSSVVIDEKQRVNFADFDYLYPVSASLLHYLDSYLEKGTMPKTLAECRLRRSVESLMALSSEVDILESFSKCFLRYPIDNIPEKTEDGDISGVMNVYASQGMVLQPYSPLPDPDGKALEHLLVPPQLGKEKMFRKSSWLYAALVLLLIYLALTFF